MEIEQIAFGAVEIAWEISSHPSFAICLENRKIYLTSINFHVNGGDALNSSHDKSLLNLTSVKFSLGASAELANGTFIELILYKV